MGTGWSMQKKWIVASIVGLAVVGGVVITAKGGDKSSSTEPKLPFRLGKVQQQDLQVSVREVGTVDPFTKVDVKSSVSFIPANVQANVPAK